MFDSYPKEVYMPHINQLRTRELARAFLFVRHKGSYFKDLKGIAALKTYIRQFVYFTAEHPEFHKVVFHEMCTQTE